MVVQMGSRFQPVEVAAMAPGVSLLTKNHVGPFIDTGFQLTKDDHWWGRVYLSADEVREMAEQLGLFDEILIDTDARLAEGEQRYQEQWNAGYAAGRGENLDALADELVERMRARVDRSRVQRVDAAGAADDQGSDGAAGPGAEAPGVQEPAGVPGPAAGHADAGPEPRGGAAGRDVGGAPEPGAGGSA